MGSIVSAPLSAAGTFLGGCCGTCVAASCCKLAGSGTLSSEQAARSVLLWLQAFTIAITVIAASTPDRWLPWTCGKLSLINMGDLGICGCTDNLQHCWADQLVYRAEASGAAVFTALLVMAASGCAEGASRANSVAKFMAVPLISVVLLFLPNEILSVFGTVATAASAVFLTVQAVLLIDFAYTWNEVWYGNAIEARRVAPASGRFQRWQLSILVASAVLFIGSIIGSVCLFIAYPDTSGRSINAVALLLAMMLLVASITEYVQHGALLTSCVVVAYTIWLVCEALAAMPSGEGPHLPAWAGLSVCSISLFSFSRGAGSPGAPSDQVALAEAGAASAGDTTSAIPASEGRVSSSDKKDFIIQCAVHIAASLYISATLAPTRSALTFGLHAAAVFLSLALYGWSLIAPYVLTGRQF